MFTLYKFVILDEKHQTYPNCHYFAIHLILLNSCDFLPRIHKWYLFPNQWFSSSQIYRDHKYCFMSRKRFGRFLTKCMSDKN